MVRQEEGDEPARIDLIVNPIALKTSLHTPQRTGHLRSASVPAQAPSRPGMFGRRQPSELGVEILFDLDGLDQLRRYPNLEFLE